MSKKTALITGATGQDGSYMVDFLLDKGYSVHVLVRQSSSADKTNWRIANHFRNDEDKHPNLEVHFGDLTDANSLLSVINKIKPDELYNFAAQGSVAVSWKNPEYTANVNALGPIRIMEILKNLDLLNSTKMYQAATSEIFGVPKVSPQTEDLPVNPSNPYAVAKLYAMNMVGHYRERYGFFGCSAILYAHDSPRKDEMFVFKKITQSLVRIKHGLQETLYLGNLDAKKDWGYAPDYVEAIWLMLQQEKPDDYILATGQMHTLRDIITKSCDILGIDIEWEGEGKNEVGIDRKTGKEIIKISEKFFRPFDPNVDKDMALTGDISKAKKVLNWQPKTDFNGLIDIMITEGEKEIK